MKQKILYSVLILLFSLSYKIQAQSNSLTDFKFNKKEIKAEDFTNIETDYILEDFKSYLESAASCVNGKSVCRAIFSYSGGATGFCDSKGFTNS